MDKRKQKTTPAPILKKEEKAGDRKRKIKGAEPEASTKCSNSKPKQQQTRPGELTDAKSDQLDESMKIRVGAKRMKKPPKSLENFICRPTIRISQRLAKGDAHSSCGGEFSSAEIRTNRQSHGDVRKKDGNDSIPTKGSTRLSSTKKGCSAPVIAASKKAPSKNTRKNDSKSLLTLEGPSYAVQPQTDSKVPLSDRIASSTLLKQTHSPPAAASPPPSSQQNSCPQDSTHILNAQNEKGEALTSSQSSQDPMVLTLNSQTSQQPPSRLEKDGETALFPKAHDKDSLKHIPCPPKKASRIRETKSDKFSNANNKEDGDSTCSKSTATNMSKDSGLLHQPSPSSKTQLLIPNTDKSAELATPENSTCMAELMENIGRNKKHDEREVTDEATKRIMEPTQTVSPVPIDSGSKNRYSSSQEEDGQCFSDTACANSDDEPLLYPKQNTVSQKKQKAKVDNQEAKMCLVKTADASFTSCKTIPQKSNINKIISIKSSRAWSSKLIKSRSAGHLSKSNQNPSPRSETSSLPKKRGRPKITRLDGSPHGSKFQKSSIELPILEHSNIPDSDDIRKLPKSTPKSESHPKCSSSLQMKKSKSLDSSSGKKGAEGKTKPSLYKTREPQLCHKRNRLIMKTIIKNINKMRVKNKDKVLTQFLSGQSQSHTTDSSQKSNEDNADSNGALSLSSLVTSFGGKLGPQINISKRGTIYVGKRRGRKPKTSSQESGQLMGQKSQQVLTESSNQSNSWSTSAERSHSFNDSQPALCRPHYSFKRLESPLNNLSPFQRRLHPSNREYDQHSAPRVTSPQKVKTIPVEKSKLPSNLQSVTQSSISSQLGSVRIQGRRTTHLARSVLVEQDRLKYKCHRKGHSCFSHDKIRRHKHKCKKKYLQLRAKRQDPAFLAEVEELVVRLSKIHIVHHVSSRGCGDEVNSGRKSGKGKAHPHVLQCLPQNLHHPTMFQINFSGYYSPQSEFSRDSLHYVGMADFKRNNRCASQPGEHIVTHCPVVHKLGFPLSAGGCYHPPFKMPLSTTSFGFGLYRGYPPSATIYPSSPFLPSYMHPYSKNPILSPSKFHKSKHNFLRRDSVLCSGKPQGTFANVTSHSSSDWFSRNSWQSKDNREQRRDKRFVDDSLRERQGTEGLLGQRKLRKEFFRRAPSSNSPCSSSAAASKQSEKPKTSPPSYIGPAHLRPLSKVRWGERQQPWRWRDSVQLEPRSRGFVPETGSMYQEDDDDGEEDLPSPSLVDRTSHRHTFHRNPNLASSAYSQMKAQRNISEVHYASRSVMRPGSPMRKESCSTGSKRASGSFQPSGSLFFEHFPQHGQETGGREKRPSISRTHFHTNSVNLFSSSSATKSSHSHVYSSKDASRNTSKLKHVKKPLRKKNLKDQEVTGSDLKRRGRGRPRKNPEPCFSPPPPATPLHFKETACPAKWKKGDRDDYTVLNAAEFMAQCEKRKGKKRDDARRSEGRVDEGNDADLSQDVDTSSPFQDPSLSVHSQSEVTFDVRSEKKYEWAGLYSNAYKTENPRPPSSPEHTLDCLEYDPEEHEHGLLPAPIHVGKYMRLKRIDFQLPYEVCQLCPYKKRPKKSLSSRRTAPSNAFIDVTSRALTEDSSCKAHKHSTSHDCVSARHRPTIEEAEEEIGETGVDNTLPNQSEHLKQQEKGSDAENIPSSLLMMPLSCEERSFVLEHGVFLVRNYEKMRDRQALLLREEVTERERENGESSRSQKGDFEDTNTKSELFRTQSERRRRGDEGRNVPSRSLAQTLQGIYDVIVSHKGSSGQTLAAPLLNLCSRKRSGSAPVDLSTVQKQLLSGHYDSLDSFHSDMLKVFHCAEKYYGCESSVGRDVKQLRDLYHSAHQEALTQSGSFL